MVVWNIQVRKLRLFRHAHFELLNKSWQYFLKATLQMAFFKFKMYLLYGIKLFLALTKMESLLTLVHMDVWGVLLIC